MARYMKSNMPFLGVMKNDRVRALRPVFEQHPLEDFESWTRAVLELWDGAKYREERYAALDLSGQPRYRKFHSIDALAMYEHIILTGAWWDYVDTAASGRFIHIFERDAKAMTKLMRKWSTRQDSFWIRRAAILSQLKRKEDTDRDLLRACIESNLGDKEFFIRKAIGWALRQLSYVDPKWVREFIRAHDAQMSGLSKREALRVLHRRR